MSHASLRSTLFVGLLVLAACGDDAPPGVDAAVDARSGELGAPCVVDGDCEDRVYCNGSELCVPSSASADARGCLAARGPCREGQTCDEAGRRCVTECATTRDADGDGVDASNCGGTDCDDANPSRFPGNAESCDAAGLDDDCDATTLAGASDGDRDGDGAISHRCCNLEIGAPIACGTDCDDSRAATGPDAAEICNDVDDDCDGAVDDGVRQSYWADADGDGFGMVGSSAMMACAPPAGFRANDGDCDDTNASINPSAYDRCDTDGSGGVGVDDDCSGAPNDPPGGCDCTDGASRPCPLPGACAASMQLCVAGTWSECATGPVAEICANELDENCNGTSDENCVCTTPVRLCGLDTGACARGLQACEGAGTWGPCEGQILPTVETCNGLDDDCDGIADDGLTMRCYVDADGDGFAADGAPSATSPCGTCPLLSTPRAPTGGAESDCDDTDRDTFPGQTRYFWFDPVRPGEDFDFDCDGVATPAYPTSYNCIYTGLGMPCGAGSFNGFNGAVCGQMADLYICGEFGSGGCSSMLASRIPVECR
jgi:hypothetical protein